MDAFVDLANRDEPVVAYLAAPLDVEVEPLTAYATLAERPGGGDGSSYAFLLESAEKTASSDPDGAFRPTGTGADRHARYSFVGFDPDAVVSVDPEGARVEALGDDRVAELVREGVATAGAAPRDDDRGHARAEGDVEVDADVDGSGDVLDRLRSALPAVERVGFPDPDRQLLTGGLVGFLAYDAVYDLWLEEVGVERPEDLPLPDAQFVLSTKTLVFDEVAGSVTLVFTPVVFPEDDPRAVHEAIRAEVRRVTAALDGADAPANGGIVRLEDRAGPREAYEDAVTRAKEHVLDGDIYQGVISRKRELIGDVDAIALYDALREVNPSPYMYLLGFDGFTVVGASPETLVSVRGDRITSNPIAGTCPRGESPVDDRRLAGEMLADGKERAEHTMLVDLARNDVRRVARPGSVRVEEFMNVLKYSHVQHIESTVTGRLAPGLDAFDATRATFPAGTLSGAPKIRAMEIIHELEEEPRGLYGGGVGYYAWTGDADMAIVIRTAIVEHGVEPVPGREPADRLTVRAGAGLVAESEPRREYDETERKMDGVLTAVERIERRPAEVDP